MERGPRVERGAREGGGREPGRAGRGCQWRAQGRQKEPKEAERVGREGKIVENVTLKVREVCLQTLEKVVPLIRGMETSAEEGVGDKMV
jgi:hypothetical protein